jgi:hypothetical protein
LQVFKEFSEVLACGVRLIETFLLPVNLCLTCVAGFGSDVPNHLSGLDATDAKVIVERTVKGTVVLEEHVVLLLVDSHEIHELLGLTEELF